MSRVMRRVVSLGSFVVLLAVLALAPASAVAAGKADAQKHFQAGKALMKAEDFKGAMVEFETSVELYPTKNGLFNLGNCYKALHRYGEALATFRRLERDYGARLGKEMRAALRRHVEEIESLIAELTVEVEPTGARIAIDGREIGTSPLPEPLVLGPGEHVLEVSLEGYETEERKLRIVSGVEQVERVKLEPVATDTAPTTAVVGEADADAAAASAGAAGPPVPVGGEDVATSVEPSPEGSVEQGPAPEELTEDGSPLSALFWVGVSGTVAFGAAAGVFWGLAKQDYDDFDKARDDYLELRETALPGDQNLNAAHDTADELKSDVETKRGIAIGLSAIGGAFLVGTVIALGVDLSSDETDTVEVAATPGGVSVSF